MKKATSKSGKSGSRAGSSGSRTGTKKRTGVGKGTSGGTGGKYGRVKNGDGTIRSGGDRSNTPGDIADALRAGNKFEQAYEKGDEDTVKKWFKENKKEQIMEWKELLASDPGWASVAEVGEVDDVFLERRGPDTVSVFVRFKPGKTDVRYSQGEAEDVPVVIE